ncbi:unnamed protein product [Prunus armeniaca]|uniref:Uncharacterized protein n=1 Tax=Prunus armeniaca TaxID=36596 RepID=A0A6J5VUU3_PRUAR|nr:unnamed protein product [Prunus armeniaca]
MRTGDQFWKAWGFMSIALGALNHRTIFRDIAEHVTRLTPEFQKDAALGQNGCQTQTGRSASTALGARNTQGKLRKKV